MTTITKERIELFIKNPLENGLTRAEQMELARITLASLEAEPIGAFHIADQQVEGTSDYIKDGEWPIDNGVIEVYAAPPAPVVPDAISTRQAISKMEECEPCDSINVAYKYGWNACRDARHKVNKNASTELPNDANLSTSSQAAPDDSGLLPCPFCGSPAEYYPDGDMEGYIIMCGNKNGDCNLQAFGFTTPEEAEKAWNTRAALLQGGQPVSQTYELPEYELPELIEGMEVSVDVSTCDFDAGHRYFGTVTEVSELDTAKNGYILLVQDAKPNFDVNGNSPVIPDGWISCNERMPDDDESKPIAIFTGKCLGKGMFVATYDDDGFFDYWEGMEIIGVSHWMPLPAAPEPDQS